jgi:hypothetical protein
VFSAAGADVDPGSDPERLQVRPLKLLTELRCLVTVKLQRIHRHRCQDLFDGRGRGVDKECHHIDEGWDKSNDLRRLLYTDRAGAWRVENQAQGIGAALHGQLRIIGSRNTANFDTRMSQLPAEPSEKQVRMIAALLLIPKREGFV